MISGLFFFFQFRYVVDLDAACYVLGGGTKLPECTPDISEYGQRTIKSSYLLLINESLLCYYDEHHELTPFL